MGGKAARPAPWMALGLLVAVAGAAAYVGTTAAPSGPGTVPAGAPSPDVRAWRGHGTLAFVSAGQLEVLASSGKLQAVTGPPATGTDASPTFSASGRWLAFLHFGPADGFAVPAPTLWIVATGGTTAHQVGTAPVGELAWSPTDDTLAYSLAGSPAAPGAAGGVWTDVPGQPPELVADVGGAHVDGVAWSPDGSRLAFDATVPGVGTPSGRPVSSLAVVPSTGGPVTSRYHSSSACLELAGWWPDGGGLLFWRDPGCSASVAADGLALESLPTGSPTPKTLATTLVGPAWWAPARGTTVAVVTGGGRSVWQAGRHVEVCSLASATCSGVPTATGTVSLAPAWTSSGTLDVAVGSARGPFGPGGPGGTADYSPAWMARWNATNRLWTGPAGGTLHPLAGAGPGALLAEPAAAGTSTVLVRDDELWLLDPARRPDAVAVAGPLFSVPAPSGYYGQVPWGSTFAWSEAAGPRRGSPRPLDALLALPGAPLP